MSHDSLEIVLNALIPFAKVELERMGSIPPVAGSLGDDGEMELHMPRGGDPGTAEELIDLLRMALRHGAREGSYRATGLVMEVRAERPSDAQPVDAIAVHLEAPGESLIAFLPFKRDESGGIHYGEIFFGPADPHAFAGNSTA